MKQVESNDIQITEINLAFSKLIKEFCQQVGEEFLWIPVLQHLKKISPQEQKLSSRMPNRFTLEF
jgi:hypothetical protein